MLDAERWPVVDLLNDGYISLEVETDLPALCSLVGVVLEENSASHDCTGIRA